MPAPRPPFVDHCLELLATLGTVRARRMFGGWGLYAEDFFVGVIIAEQLYLKADATTRDQFAAAGGAPFTYTARGETRTINCWTVPAECLESPRLMQPWARLALQAAVAKRVQAAPRPAKPKLKPAGGRAGRG